MLDVLGLDPVEEAIYVHLVGVASASADGVASAMAVDAGPARLALASLLSRGLVSRSAGGVDHYVASPPAVALGSLLLERQQELQRAEVTLTALADRYRSAAARTPTDVVDVVLGAEAVAQRMAQLQRVARRELLVFVRAGVAVVSAEDNAADEDDAVERGVKIRVVVERDVLQNPGFVESAANATARGEAVKVAGDLPLRMLVSDRELAMIPLPPRESAEGTAALLVHPSGLLDGLVSLFEHVWATSTPLGATTHEGLTDLDGQVMSLLLAGLTDQAIGSQLGLSMRTVQRRVSHLMDMAGVTTRVQLGWEANRRDWV